MYKPTDIIVQGVERNKAKQNYQIPQINSQQDFPSIPTTEKGLVGSQNSTKELMMSMNQIVRQMSQMMDLVNQMMIQNQQ